VDFFSPDAPPATVASRGPPLGASTFITSAAPAGELVVVERISVRVVSIRSVDLVAILVFFEDLLVIWLF
jgi:hypothetical protein